PEAVTPQARHVWIDDTQDSVGSDGGVHSAAAALEHPQSRCARQVVGRCDDSAWCMGGRSACAWTVGMTHDRLRTLPRRATDCDVSALLNEPDRKPALGLQS